MGKIMLQNIKVDIIYYKTATDFEMEFNLCGCCRMRLLTDKAPDRRSMVQNLARAVSRSRVIIIVGSLFGEEGILNTVSGAIGKTLTKIDNKLYGISDSSEISVISGATPLVTSDGCFGGCIIESGPQSMIMLSDGKSVRKAIMQSLIHPYIEELCAGELKTHAEAAAQKAAEAEVAPAQEPEALPQDDDIANLFSSSGDNAAEAADEEPLPDLAAETAVPEHDVGLQSESIESDITDISQEAALPLDAYAAAADKTALPELDFPDEDVFTEPASNDKPNNDFCMKPSAAPHRSAAQGSDSSDELPYRIGGDFPEKPRPFLSDSMPLVIILIALLVIAAILCYCIFVVPARSGISSSEYLRNIFDTLLGRSGGV